MHVGCNNLDILKAVYLPPVLSLSPSLPPSLPPSLLSLPLPPVTVVGEPPMCMSCSTLFALKAAIRSARAEIGKDDYFTLSMWEIMNGVVLTLCHNYIFPFTTDGPATVEDVQLACMVDQSQFFF